MPEEVIELADLVTEMNLIKHPFDRGILCQTRDRVLVHRLRLGGLLT